MSNKTIKAYLSIITSMIIFGTLGIFRKSITLSSSMLACFRGLLGSLFLLIFVYLKGNKLQKIDSKKLALLCLSGGLMGLNWMLLFEAYNYTSVSIATMCYYMQPTIVILLSPLVFHEKLTSKKIICVVASIIGMLLVSGITSGESSQSINFKGILFGLSAAILYASVVMLNKKIIVDDVYEKTIIQLFTAAITLVPYILFTEDLSTISFNTTSIIMTIFVGIVHTGIAYALYFGSIKTLKTQSIAILSYIDPVCALILSALILHELLTIQGIIGAVFIILAAIFSELTSD